MGDIACNATPHMVGYFFNVMNTKSIFSAVCMYLSSTDDPLYIVFHDGNNK